ncbi:MULTISPECIES: hypothetical protein [unclassified Pseudomonas]|uniref:hypothetical protein n=1 Tax=unclassified Pseudomonas TaxID=196821 RepID=UPI0030DA5C4F
MNQASSRRVSRKLQGHVLLLGLDRVAKRNAFDLDLLNELSLTYGEFDRNADARVAVVFAHGDHFTAGLDLANVSAVMAVGWQPPLGVQATLMSARLAHMEGEAVAAAALPPVVDKLLNSEDAEEGVRAMIEKRPGVFKGI